MVNVYCEKVKNQLTEKFRTFSGTAQMTIEVRHSQDRLEGLQDSLQLYTDAATQVLAANRGDWAMGCFTRAATKRLSEPSSKAERISSRWPRSPSRLE